MRAGIYVRISSDPGETRGGVRRQEKLCRELASARGWEVVGVYCDNDTSASGRVPRPEYRRLLSDLRSGAIDAVVAWHTDRLYRRNIDLEELVTVIEATKAKVATVESGDFDLEKAAGRMVARHIATAAGYEIEHMAERIKAKHRQLAEAGIDHGGGARRFGYKPDRHTIEPREAKLIRAAADRVLAGGSIRGIVADWNTRGVPTSTGAPWSQTVLRRILLSPRIAGLREHRGEIVTEAIWPGIIDRPTHERLVATLKDPQRRTNHGARSYLLTGFAYCGPCGAKLVARPRADKRRCYVCASGPSFGGCGKLRSLSEPLEELILEAILQRVDHPDFWARLAARSSNDSGRDDRAELGDLDRRLAELAEMWADGDLSRKEWMTARRRLESKREALQRSWAAASSTTALNSVAGRGTLREQWPALAFDQRRAVLAAVVDRVTVGPAVRGRNTFDPDRVDVTWRA